MKRSEIVLPPGVPEDAIDLLLEIGYFEQDTLKPGDAVPAIGLTALNTDSIVSIGGPGGARPVLLIFGSYT